MKKPIVFKDITNIPEPAITSLKESLEKEYAKGFRDGGKDCLADLDICIDKFNEALEEIYAVRGRHPAFLEKTKDKENERR